MAYDPSGNWLDDRGRNLGQPQWTDNNGGFWFTLNADQNDFVTVPAPPTQVNTDPRGPGGTQTTADPLHPGFWYRDDSNVSGGIQRIDAQGNVVGTYGYQGPLSQGGSGWDITHMDPATGGPMEVNYPSEAGGLFGLGDVWGSIVGAAMIAALGVTAGVALPALGGAEAGAAAGVGAGEAAGLSGEGALWGAAGAVPEALASPLPLAGLEGFTGTAVGAGELGADAGAVGGAAADFAVGGAAAGEGTAAGSGGLGGLLSTYGPYASAGSTVLGGASQLAGGGSSAPGYGNEPYYGESTTGSDIPGMQTDWGTVGVDPNTDPTNWLQTLRTLAPVLGPAISGVGSLVGGGLQAGAAKEAATIQANAAHEANMLLAQIYGQQRQDQMPYMQAGYNALGQIQGMPNFSEQPYAYNAPAPLDPAQYQFAPPSGQDVLNQDPGYQFRLDQGMKALQQSAAAKGGLLSGGTMKGIERFSQGLASQEYQNAYQRSLTQNQMGYERNLQANQQDYERGLGGNQMAYNRALTSYGTNLGRLQSLAGVGQSASGILANAAGQYGSGAAGNLTSAGAATAAGRVGASNAIAGGISGVGGAANSYLNYSLLSDLLNRKSA